MKFWLLTLLIIFSSLSFAQSVPYGLFQKDLLQFETWEDAAEFTNQWYIQALGAPLDITPRTPLTYARPESLLKDIFKEFQKLYPHLTEDFLPHLIIYESESIGGSAWLYDPDTQKSPRIIKVSSSLLDHLEPSFLHFILVHELAHSLLQFQDKSGSLPRDKYYLKKSSVQFGSQIINNSKVQKVGMQYTSIGKLIGYYAAPELTIHTYVDGPFGLERLLSNYLTATQADNPDCQLIAQILNMHLNIHSGFFINRDNYVLKDSHLEIATEKSERSNDYLKVCAQNIKVSFDDFLTQALSIKSSQIVHFEHTKSTSLHKKHIKRLKQIFKNNRLYKSYTQAIQFLKRELRKLENKIPIEQIRIYNAEDFADEVTLQVMNEMNFNPEPFNKMLTEISKVNCSKQTQTSYGELHSTHHSNCWRAQRNRLYQKYLSK